LTFPGWEHFIPRLGIFVSQAGNKKGNRFRMGAFGAQIATKCLTLIGLMIESKETQFSCILFRFFVSLQADRDAIALINHK
jgi:hypothetical protein